VTSYDTGVGGTARKTRRSAVYLGTSGGTVPQSTSDSVVWTRKCEAPSAFRRETGREDRCFLHETERARGRIDVTVPFKRVQTAEIEREFLVHKTQRSSSPSNVKVSPRRI